MISASRASGDKSARPSLLAGLWARLRRLTDSLVGKLAILAIVMVVVPNIVYWELEEADSQKNQLLLDAVREQGRLISLNLTPLLTREDPSPLLDLPGAVETLATDNTGVKVLFRPKNVYGSGQFFFVAAEPPLPPARLAEERDRLVEQGVLSSLSDSCAGQLPIALRHQSSDGSIQLLSSITPVTTGAGCWAVVTSHSSGDFLGTSIGKPYWKTLEIRFAAWSYAAMVVLTLLLFFTVWRNLMRFRETARRIRQGKFRDSDWPEAGFVGQNRVPELMPVAAEFDHMTQALRQSADDLRQAAEDNSHAFKTPIAIMRQSMEPLQRALPAEDRRGQRALEVVEASIERLDRLVSCARQLDEGLAELLDPPRDAVNLSQLTTRLLESYQEAARHRDIRLRLQIAEGQVVRAGEELLEVVIENVMDNALEASPGGDRVEVGLKPQGDWVVLTIRDRGPGVAPDQLEWIFERYASLRPRKKEAQAEAQGAHLGIGLWIVRRNLEAIGGSATASNAPDGGLVITLRFPKAQS
ncbi:sensor histidine kinase [Rhodovibrionaceae bacterium A322]